MLEEMNSLKSYLDEISKIQVLSRAEETTLIPAAQAGDREAFESIIRANLRYVVTIANEYKDRGIPLMDVIGEGNMGLFRALKTFDSTRGIRFITYAKWWIRQYIIHALIYKSHTVRIPQSQLRKMRKLKKARESQQRLEPQARFHDYFDGGENSRSFLHDCLVQQHSLDQPFGEDKRNRLIDYVPDQQATSPDESANKASLQTDLKLAFSILKEREIDVIKMLFGLDLSSRATLGDVAVKYGISRERVRQIKNDALDKLRDSEEVRKALINYLG